MDTKRCTSVSQYHASCGTCSCCPTAPGSKPSLDDTGAPRAVELTNVHTCMQSDKQTCYSMLQLICPSLYRTQKVVTEGQQRTWAALYPSGIALQLSAQSMHVSHAWMFSMPAPATTDSAFSGLTSSNPTKRTSGPGQSAVSPLLSGHLSPVDARIRNSAVSCMSDVHKHEQPAHESPVTAVRSRLVYGYFGGFPLIEEGYRTNRLRHTTQSSPRR